MTQRELDVDILKSLSTIEGAIRGSGQSAVIAVVEDELDWIINLLVRRLKEKPDG